MYKGHTVVDVDAHYMEALEDLAEYMEEPWRTRIREGRRTKRLFPKSSGNQHKWGQLRREHTSYPEGKMTPEQIPEIMDALGIDKTIIISHTMLATAYVEADDLRTTVFARSYVDYILDNVVDPDQDIHTAIPLPYHNPPAAAELIEDVADEAGIVAGCVVTAGAEPPLGNRSYDVMYEAAEKAGLPIIFHTGGAGLDQYHRRGYGKFMETHVLGFLESNLSQLTSLVVQGVTEKFPDLDVIFMESGVFWVACLMARLDEEYLKRTEEAPLLTKRPSEYMKDFHYGTQPLEATTEEKYLKNIIEMIEGPTTMMYASDYPHWDFDSPSVINELSFLSDDEIGNVLGGNAEKVFGI